MYRTILYSEEIWSAFGEPPVFGVMKPAKAAGARISATASAALTASAIRAVRWRVSPGRKAAAFYPAPPRPGRAAGFEDGHRALGCAVLGAADRRTYTARPV